MWVTVLVAVIGSSAMASLVTLLTEAVKRRWKKQDEAEKITPERIAEIERKIDALVKCEKVFAIDKIRYLGLCYIGAKGITLEEKETLHEMHDAYEALGGNGHLDTVMDEVDKLQVVKSRFEAKEAGV